MKTIVDSYAVATSVTKEPAGRTNHDEYQPSSPEASPRRPPWSCATDIFHVSFALGVPQGLNGAANSLLGHTILRLTRPDDVAYDVRIVAATTTGLVGAITFHTICVFSFVALLFLCVASCSSDPSPLPHPAPELRRPPTPSPRQLESEWYEDFEKRADSPIRTQLCGVWPLWLGIPLCMARAAAVGALGAALLKHSALVPMDARDAAVTNLVGAAILYVPRGAMSVVCRVLRAREYRAYHPRCARVEREVGDSERCLPHPPPPIYPINRTDVVW